MKTKKIAGGALFVIGAYRLLYPKGSDGVTVPVITAWSGGSMRLNDVMALEGMNFWVNLALIAGGAYLFVKG